MSATASGFDPHTPEIEELMHRRAVDQGVAMGSGRVGGTALKSHNDVRRMRAADRDPATAVLDEYDDGPAGGVYPNAFQRALEEEIRGMLAMGQAVAQRSALPAWAVIRPGDVAAATGLTRGPSEVWVIDKWLREPSSDPDKLQFKLIAYSNVQPGPRSARLTNIGGS